MGLRGALVTALVAIACGLRLQGRKHGALKCDAGSSKHFDWKEIVSRSERGEALPPVYLFESNFGVNFVFNKEGASFYPIERDAAGTVRNARSVGRNTEPEKQWVKIMLGEKAYQLARAHDAENKFVDELEFWKATRKVDKEAFDPEKGIPALADGTLKTFRAEYFDPQEWNGCIEAAKGWVANLPAGKERGWQKRRGEHAAPYFQACAKLVEYLGDSLASESFTGKEGAMSAMNLMQATDSVEEAQNVAKDWKELVQLYGMAESFVNTGDFDQWKVDLQATGKEMNSFKDELAKGMSSKTLKESWNKLNKSHKKLGHVCKDLEVKLKGLGGKVEQAKKAFEQATAQSQGGLVGVAEKWAEDLIAERVMAEDLMAKELWWTVVGDDQRWVCQLEKDAHVALVDKISLPVGKGDLKQDDDSEDEEDELPLRSGKGNPLQSKKDKVARLRITETKKKKEKVERPTGWGGARPGSGPKKQARAGRAAVANLRQ